MRKKTDVMIHRLPITKARINLGEVARRVHVHKEYFILEKDGIPVAGIMDAEELEDYLESHDPKVRSHIQKSTAAYRTGKSRLAKELVAELRQKPKAKRRRI